MIGYWAVKLYNGKSNNLTTNQQVITDWANISVSKKDLLPASISISNDVEYYNLGKWKLNDLKGALTLRLRSECKMDTIQPSLLVYEIMRKGESVKWEAIKLERQMEKSGKWNNILFMRNLSDLQKDDVVILYVWNISKSLIQLKNTQVEFLK